MKSGDFSLCVLFSVLAFSSFAVFGREPLTFEQRVKAQEAIEKVYYNHRIWPKENKTTKPAFEKMVSKETIEAKVIDYLKKSAALEKYWYRPITGEQLQAEMDRMAKGTKDPATLNELFEALNNDPYLIAECLARPVLADRLIRNWYANDDRFHKETREKAEEALKHLTPENFCNYPEGQYSITTYRLENEPNEEREILDPEDHSIGLDEVEFEKMYGEVPEEGNISGVIEKDDCFLIIRSIEKQKEQIKIGKILFTEKEIGALLGVLNVSKTTSEINNDSLFTLPQIIETSSCDGKWEDSLLSQVPERRSQHVAVWTGSEMIVWGGFSYGWANDGGRYNPSTDTWELVSIGHNCPAAISPGRAAVWTGTEMIVYGYEQGSYQNVGGRYNPLINSWLTMSLENSPRFQDGPAIWSGQEMIVWNSSKGGGKYNPRKDIWTEISEVGAPSGRSGHSAIWTGKEMIIWGGIYNNVDLNDGGRYNPEKDTWSSISLIDAPQKRYDHTAVWTGEKMIVWGGGHFENGGGGLNTGGQYDPSTDTWTIVSTSASTPSARWRHEAVWSGSEMIIWGGYLYDSNSGITNSGGRYNPFTDSWIPTSILGAPSARAYFTAVWTGTEMIVWGGHGGNTGGRYSPVTDSWIPTATSAGEPTGRMCHTAVWTGSEMIIWGGMDDAATLFNTGGIYDPSLDSWRSTSTGMNCPSGRCFNTAIWTGSEMIIWGGYLITGDQSCYLNTGGRYNPASDSWVPTSVNGNVPAERIYHTASWTGSEMIIWGGEIKVPPHYCNTGGKYDPSLDSWKLVTTAGAPLSRAGHTAIWTGTEMIIWGGYVYPDYFNTGGRYNPLRDEWTATQISEAPSPREDHSAIWTGTEMIVWGGGVYGGMNTGGRYNPVTDSWLQTDVGLNCPSGRVYHTAAWTGTEMIVWGGEGSSFPLELNTGGKYSPDSNSWIETPMEGPVPTRRLLHTAVWTGSLMIVWGGNSSGLRSGGIYYPGCPPITINSVSALKNPFRLKIFGSKFQQGASVQINGVTVPQTMFKSEGLLVAGKGASLKAMVPKGTTVMITVVNPDGGVSEEFPYTR